VHVQRQFDVEPLGDGKERHTCRECRTRTIVRFAPEGTDATVLARLNDSRGHDGVEGICKTCSRQLAAERYPEGRDQWRCPICKKLLVLRPTTETADTFRARCAEHERQGNICRAEMLGKRLHAEGLVPLRTMDGHDFVFTHNALKGAGLVTQHQTHVVMDYVRSTPWGPRWAAHYDTYLFRQLKLPLTRRIAALIEAAATAESRDSAVAFVALAEVPVDLDGFP